MHFQITDDQNRTLILDGDVDLLDQLVIALKAEHNHEHRQQPVEAPMSSASTPQGSGLLLTTEAESAPIQCYPLMDLHF
jgi:hypothetical protein